MTNGVISLLELHFFFVAVVDISRKKTENKNGARPGNNKLSSD